MGIGKEMKINFVRYNQRNRKKRPPVLSVNVSWDDVIPDYIYLQMTRTGSKKAIHVFTKCTDKETVVVLEFPPGNHTYNLAAAGLTTVIQGSRTQHLPSRGYYKVCASSQKEVTVARDLSAPVNPVAITHIDLEKSYELPVKPKKINAEMQLNMSLHQQPAATYICNLPCPIVGFNAYLVSLRHVTSGQDFLFLHSHRVPVFTFPIDLESADEYTVQVMKLELMSEAPDTNNLVYLATAVSRPLPFTIPMSRTEVHELYSKALGFRQINKRHMYPISHFYRDKRPEYYDLAVRTGILPTYLKNQNGDKASSLNGQLAGIFVSTWVHPATQRPAPFSLFGSRRLHIPVNFLLNHRTNLYFADFYCHYQHHKIMLVITVRGSMADRFCAGRLVPLDPFDNDFLCLMTPGSSFPAKVTLKVNVDVFYTEEIQLQKIEGMFITVVERRRGTSNHAVGLPKNTECEICNLDKVVKRNSKLKQEKEN